MRRRYGQDPLLWKVWDAFWLGFGFLTGAALAAIVALIVLTFLLNRGWLL